MELYSDNLGTVYLNIGDYENTKEIYQKLMKLKPVFPGVL